MEDPQGEFFVPSIGEDGQEVQRVGVLCDSDKEDDKVGDEKEESEAVRNAEVVEKSSRASGRAPAKNAGTNYVKHKFRGTFHCLKVDDETVLACGKTYSEVYVEVGDEEFIHPKCATCFGS